MARKSAIFLSSASLAFLIISALHNNMQSMSVTSQKQELQIMKKISHDHTTAWPCRHSLHEIGHQPGCMKCRQSIAVSQSLSNLAFACKQGSECAHDAKLCLIGMGRTDKA